MRNIRKNYNGNKYNDFNQKKYDDQKNTFIVLKITLALQYEI